MNKSYNMIIYMHMFTCTILSAPNFFAIPIVPFIVMFSVWRDAGPTYRVAVGEAIGFISSTGRNETCRALRT